MIYDTVSKFTAENDYQVDDLVLLSDQTIPDESAVRQHDSLLRENKFSQASKVLQDSNMHYYGASLMNMIENRVCATQTYLFNKHSKWYDSHGVDFPWAYGKEPSNPSATPVWIED